VDHWCAIGDGAPVSEHRSGAEERSAHPTDDQATTGGPEGPSPAVQVAAHLQAAALEVIAAFRAVLDAAEQTVRDPATAFAARARRRSSKDPEKGKGGGDHVQRIPLS
jgi:hypothetical protein